MTERARWAIAGSVIAVVTAGVLVTPPGRTAGTSPSPDPGDYALLAQRSVKVVGALTVDRAGLRVNLGELVAAGARLDANGQDLVASRIVLGPGSVCGAAFGDQVSGASARCPAVAEGPIDPLVLQIGDACVFPEVLKACGGAGIDVPRNTTQTLAGGTPEAPAVHGDVTVQGDAAMPGVLRLSGGTYVFCQVALARGARLVIDGPAQVFVAERLRVSPDAVIGASPVSGTRVEDVRVFVDGNLVRLARNSRFDGMLCAPGALVALARDARVTGQLVADRVRATRAYVSGIVPGSVTTSSTVVTIPPPTTPPPTLPKLKMTIKAGTTSCGGPGFFPHCTGGANLGGTDGRGSCATNADCGTNGICSNLGPPPAPPFSGQVSGTAGKLADLGAGCLYIGGGGNVSVGGGAIPLGSSQYFDITATNGANLTLGPSAGVGDRTGYNVFPVGEGNKNCSAGAGPARHCANPGPTSGQACTVDADCSAVVTNVCLPDFNCYFGPPLPIPNPNNPGLATCFITGFEVDGNGTANTAANGAVMVNIQLSSRIYLTGNATSPCPICNAANQCSRGPRAGQACVPHNGANATSVDCPPDGMFQAALPIELVSLTTGPTQMAAADGRFCAYLGQNNARAGAFGLKLARIIQEAGVPSPAGIGSAPAPVTLGSTFCIPPVSSAIDPSVSLPGPGALSLVTDMSLFP